MKLFPQPHIKVPKGEVMFQVDRRYDLKWESGIDHHGVNLTEVFTALRTLGAGEVMTVVRRE